MAVVLADRALTVVRRSHEWKQDARGVPMPTGDDTLTTVGPFPGAAKPQTADTWSLRVDPRCWPMRAGDRITDGTLTWVADSDPILHAVPGVPDVDYIRVSATLDPPQVLEVAEFVAVPGLDELVAQMIAPEVGKIAKQVELTARRLAPPTKKWVTMGDNAVRHTHRGAGGQEVPENLRFRVEGQPWDVQHGLSIGIDWMLHPKDTSTGLPSDAVQNVYCRCTEALDPTAIADKIVTGPTNVYGTLVRVVVSCTAVQVVACEFGDSYPSARGDLRAEGTHFMGRAAARVAGQGGYGPTTDVNAPVGGPGTGSQDNHG